MEYWQLFVPEIVDTLHIHVSRYRHQCFIYIKKEYKKHRIIDNAFMFLL